MSQGDEFELQGEVIRKLEREQGAECGQKREHAVDGHAAVGMNTAKRRLHLPGILDF